MTSSRELISDLVHRYSDAVVHQDQGRWASCWAEDARWELGPGRRLVGRRAIVKHWQESIDRIEVVVQLVGNGRASVSGRRGEGRWYITEHLRRHTGEVGLLLAYYDDTYVQVEGRWLFASRQLTPIYHGPPDLSAAFRLPASRSWPM